MTRPVLIISAMATGGQVLHHLKQRLPDARTTVLLVGYQAMGTRGRQLQEAATSLGLFGEQVPVRAHVRPRVSRPRPDRVSNEEGQT